MGNISWGQTAAGDDGKLDMKMTPYPKYKPTELPWLPQIPEHWELNRAKNLYSKANRPVAPNAEVVTCFRDGQVTLRKNRRTNGFTESLKEIGYQGIIKGDLVIHVMDAFAGAVGVSDSDGKGTPVYSVCAARSEQTNNFYYAIIVREMAKRGFIQSLYRGIRERSSDFRYEVFAAQYLPVPPPDEQEQIVRYLDSMTAKINKLIRAKKTICDLIIEKIIRRTNEYIDDKRIHRRRLKSLIKLVSDEIVRDDNVLYTPIGVLNRGRGIFHKKQLLGKNLGDSVFYHVFPGDLIFSGQFAWEGAVAILQQSEEGCIASHRYPLARAIDPNVLRLEYLWAFFQTKFGNMLLNIHSHGAAGRNRPLNILRLLGETIPVPSQEKQMEIANLFHQLQIAKKLAANYADELREYKNSLISSVVTGQIDVRNIHVDDFDPADLVPEMDDDADDENVTEENEE